ncbi:MAG TPA: hypothetical protein VF384_03505 [Planctomycetota bacterium]
MSARLAALVPFLAACAAPSASPSPSSPLIDVQLPLAASAENTQIQWAVPLDRHPRLRTARVGQVPVPGTWTAYVEFDRADGNWLHALHGEHGNVRVTWAGFELITDGRKGYIEDGGSQERAEEALTQLPMSAAPASSSKGKR